MFYQTEMSPSDTDSLRFLCWSESIEDPPEDCKMLFHTFGAKSSPRCAERQSIPPALTANPLLDLDLDHLALERALGVYWDAQSDTCKFKAVHAGKPPTKRGILPVIRSLFDPLGFLFPSSNILLQEFWRDKLPWDQEIPEPYLWQWQRWLEELPHIITIDILRCHTTFVFGTPTTIEMHNFADASRRCYTAVTYLRLVDKNGAIHCFFVMGKTLIAPIRQSTIPHLKLQAAV
ncbi:hypothetical protein ACROYT_G019405 [Oculina patagonica]